MQSPRSFPTHIGLCMLLGGAIVAGCSRPLPDQFAQRALPEGFVAQHAEQINQHLGNTFGVPAYPRFQLPAEEQPEPKPDAKPGETKVVYKDQIDRLHLRHGMQVYNRQCAGCHGVSGDGMGPAAQNLNPLPRDYRLGVFKFTSTPRGAKPRREDLARIIRRGAKGTSMPSFRWMAEEDLQAVIDYVITLSVRGEVEYRVQRVAAEQLGEEEPVDFAIFAEELAGIRATWDEAASQQVLPITAEPLLSDETVQAGAKAFIELNCYKCHGKDGRGNKAFNVGKDEWGHTAFAADLTSGTLHGGRRPVDIYRRIYSGINGTPMPGFKDPDAAKEETELQRSAAIWHLTHFVTAIIEAKPLPLEVIEEAAKIQAEKEAAAAKAANP